MIFWIFFAGLTALTIVIDRKQRARQAQHRGVVDFSDSNPFAYLVFAVITPFLVLPVYFYSTRKVMGGDRLLAVFVGLGLSVACFFGAMMLTIPLMIAR